MGGLILFCIRIELEEARMGNCCLLDAAAAVDAAAHDASAPHG